MNTFVTSIPALLLYEPLLKHANYILGPGTHTRIALGASLEILLAIANIATAVVLYPILKRQSQSISLGYVASRTLESTVILIGVVSVLSVVTLPHDVGGAGAANSASLVLVERSLVAIHDWTFLLGPAFCAGVGTGRGQLFFGPLLMILFRQKYPRWWFDWNLELQRFSNRVGAYMMLMDDRYPSTTDYQSVHLDYDYPNVESDLNRWLPW